MNGRGDGGETPLVSVVVPAFNAEGTIAATLCSISAQTWTNLEILVVDDGSTDGTAAIAEAWCASEPRARLIRKANGGVASARNRGIAEAKGEWIAPVDADDLWHAAKVERQVAAALKAPEPPGFVYCWSRFIDEAGRVTGSMEAHDWNGRALGLLLARNAVGNGSALLIRADAARAVGGYDESLHERGVHGAEDALIQIEIAARHPIACVPEYLVGYRVRAGAMSGDVERMHGSWTASRRMARERHGPVAGRGFRRGKARRHLELAEGRALAGKARGAAGALGLALLLDPARIGAELLYRAVRKGARIAARARTAAERPDFSDCPTTGHIEGDVHAIAPMIRLLERWDRLRLAKIEREAG